MFCVLKVKVNSEVATGTGPNKKVAKRNAAEAMLLQLGYKASTVAAGAPEVTTCQLNHAVCSRLPDVSAAARRLWP